MLCLRHIYSSALRCCQFQTLTSDTLLRQLNNCTAEDQVFDLVGKNKAKLSEKHVRSAITLLGQFQKENFHPLRNIDYIKNHSQFITPCMLAENKIQFMDNDLLVDMLYHVLRIASLLHRHLDKFKPLELVKIAQALVLLHCQNAELYTKLRGFLVGYLQVNVISHDISMITHALSMFLFPQMNEVVINRVDAVFLQYHLDDLNTLATALARWVPHVQSHWQSTSGPRVKLLQNINNCTYERLQKASVLDLLLN